MRVSVSGVEKHYGATRALDGAEMELGDEVSVLALIGPSGGGKSTLLRVVGGLEVPDAGEVTIDGEQVDYQSSEALLAYRRRNGFLFQSFNLFPHKSALENIIFTTVPKISSCSQIAKLALGSVNCGRKAM